MSTKRPLTGVQRRLLAALQSYLSEHEALPTARDLADLAGLRSEAVVRYQLGWLVSHGYLQHDSMQPGDLRIVSETDAGVDVPGVERRATP